MNANRSAQCEPILITLEDVLNHARHIADRQRQIAFAAFRVRGSLLGPQPEKMASESEEPQALGYIMQLHQVLCDIDRWQSDAMDTLTGIESRLEQPSSASPLKH